MLLSVEIIPEFSKTTTVSEKGLSHRCAWSLLERLYQQHISPTFPSVSREKTGKPYFTTGNHHFNISHSGNLVAVAISSHSVGVDVQVVKSPSSSLIQRVCSIDEQEWLAGLPVERLPLGFTALWTGKEAIQKESGEGIGNGRNLSAVSIPYTSDCAIFSQSYTNEIFLHRILGKTHCLALACKEEIDVTILNNLFLL